MEMNQRDTDLIASADEVDQADDVSTTYLDQVRLDLEAGRLDEAEQRLQALQDDPLFTDPGIRAAHEILDQINDLTSEVSIADSSPVIDLDSLPLRQPAPLPDAPPPDSSGLQGIRQYRQVQESAELPVAAAEPAVGEPFAAESKTLAPAQKPLFETFEEPVDPALLDQHLDEPLLDEPLLDEPLLDESMAAAQKWPLWHLKVVIALLLVGFGVYFGVHYLIAFLNEHEQRSKDNIMASTPKKSDKLLTEEKAPPPPPVKPALRAANTDQQQPDQAETSVTEPRPDSVEAPEPSVTPDRVIADATTQDKPKMPDEIKSPDRDAEPDNSQFTHAPPEKEPDEKPSSNNAGKTAPQPQVQPDARDEQVAKADAADTGEEDRYAITISREPREKVLSTQPEVLVAMSSTQPPAPSPPPPQPEPEVEIKPVRLAAEPADVKIAFERPLASSAEPGPMDIVVARVFTMPHKRGATFKFDQGLFTGACELSVYARMVLRDFKRELLKLPPQYHIVVAGHTDDSPLPENAEADNHYELGLKRARLIMDYLRSDGGPSIERFFINSHGKQQPPFPNNMENNRARNNTVVIHVLYRDVLDLP